MNEMDPFRFDSEGRKEAFVGFNAKGEEVWLDADKAKELLESDAFNDDPDFNGDDFNEPLSSDSLRISTHRAAEQFLTRFNLEQGE